MEGKSKCGARFPDQLAHISQDRVSYSLGNARGRQDKGKEIRISL
jgi:hypothetical protein